MGKYLDQYRRGGAVEGNRNGSLYCAVLCAREERWDEQEIYSVLGGVARDTGLSDAEVNATIRSAMKKEITEHQRKKYKDSGKVVMPVRWEEEEQEQYAGIYAPSEYWKDTALLLRTLFRPEEHVALMLNWHTDEHSGETKPSGRGTHMQVKQLCDRLEANTRLDNMLTVDKRQGGFYRLNPVKQDDWWSDAGVKEYRYALIESDELTVQEQLRIIRELNIPCAAVCHSGNKSVHGIVRIDAGHDRLLYDSRVELLYDYLESKGFTVDRQNKNPSRMTRLAGMERQAGKEGKQYIIHTEVGYPSWQEFEDKQLNSEKKRNKFPDIHRYIDLLDEDPQPSEEVIAGLLRRGHKLLLSGPSKAGKSFAMIQLAAAVSSGSKWLGVYQCKESKVLYMNLEIEKGSFHQRCKDVNAQIPINPENLDVWNLRGFTQPLDVLKPKILSKVRDEGYGMIIIDPIYKTITGDENNATDMTYFCNLLDGIAKDTGATIVIASHFSKGEQIHKESIDRTSGSGVFGRDPDAIATMTKIPVATLEGVGAVHLRNRIFYVDWVLREFRSPDRVPVEFVHPVHRHDMALHQKINSHLVAKAGGKKAQKDTDPKPTGDQTQPASTGKKGRPAKLDPFGMAEEARNQMENNGGQVHIDVLAKALDVAPKTIRKYIDDNPALELTVIKGVIWDGQGMNDEVREGLGL